MIQDRDFGDNNESKVGEIFSLIEIKSGLNIQDKRNKEENTESTNFSLYFTFSQIVRDKHYTKWYLKRTSSNPRIKIENC